MYSDSATAAALLTDSSDEGFPIRWVAFVVSDNYGQETATIVPVPGLPGAGP